MGDKGGVDRWYGVTRHQLRKRRVQHTLQKTHTQLSTYPKHPHAPPVKQLARYLAKWDRCLATPVICSASSRVGASTRTRGRFGREATPARSVSLRISTGERGKLMRVVSARGALRFQQAPNPRRTPSFTSPPFLPTSPPLTERKQVRQGLATSSVRGQEKVGAAVAH